MVVETGDSLVRIPAVTRILVVDDSSVNRAVLKSLLIRGGAKDIVMAENGKEALEKLRADAQIGAVLTDLWMPVIDGEGLIKAIRADEKLKQLPVYLITADVESVKDYKQNGFTGICLKPVTLATVKALIQV